MRSRRPPKARSAPPCAKGSPCTAVGREYAPELGQGHGGLIEIVQGYDRHGVVQLPAAYRQQRAEYSGKRQHPEQQLKPLKTSRERQDRPLKQQGEGPHHQEQYQAE